MPQVSDVFDALDEARGFADDMEAELENLCDEMVGLRDEIRDLEQALDDNECPHCEELRERIALLECFVPANVSLGNGT